MTKPLTNEPNPRMSYDERLSQAIGVYAILRSTSIDTLHQSGLRYDHNYNEGLFSLVAEKYDVKIEDLKKQPLRKVKCLLTDKVLRPHKKRNHRAGEGGGIV